MGNLVYVADAVDGIRVISVSRPEVPEETGYYVTGSGAAAVAANDCGIYVADQADGLQILWYIPLWNSCLSAAPGILMPAAQSINVYPNPFNPRTRIHFVCKNEGFARLTVFDLAGREVAVLHDGWLDAGPHESAWNGRDQRGRGVASGPYLVRLEAGGEVHSQKVLLAK